MRKALKWLTRIVVVLALATAAVGLWKRDQIARLWAVNSLFDEERIVQNFSHMDRA
ncbi:MAG: 6-aminohexanoate hydrolase, partial [Roseovarius sp.]|nr:6-aminohexanoate hydrolase [Roseovarius sp.]